MTTSRRQSAYEVLRITDGYRSGAGGGPAEHEHVVTMWDKQQAELLASVINGEAGRDIYNQPIVRRIGVVVTGNEVLYGKVRDNNTVPAAFIAADMNQAFAIIALSKQR